MQRLALVVAVALAACKGAAKPGNAPTCVVAADHIAAGMVKLREDISTAGLDPAPALVQLCTDDDWDGEVVRCYAATELPRELRACSDRLTSDQRVRARELQETIYRRASEVSGDDGDGGITGIASCNELIEQAQRYADCPSSGMGVREQFEITIQEQLERVGAMSGDESERAAIERDCTAYVQSVKQRIAMEGC